MIGSRWHGWVFTACAVLGAMTQGCGSDDTAPTQPDPAACPAGSEVAGVCAGTSQQALCSADVCTDGATCATVVTVRREQDGGKYTGSEDTRMVMLREAIANGVEYIDLEEPKIISPIIMSHRKNDRSPLLAQLVKLVREFDHWEASAGPQ